MILVKQVREEIGISQAELARMSGVKQQNISKIESGENRTPGIETLNALAMAMSCSLADLYKPGTEGTAI